MKPKSVVRLILLLLAAWALTWAAVQALNLSNGV